MPMQTIWKGSIVFGLVNVPIRLYSAAEDHDVHLHQTHDKDGGQLRYQRRCEICDQLISHEHIQRAYDAGEQTVTLTQDEIDELPSVKNREIEIVRFVPADQVDPLGTERSYFLGPDSSTPKAYILLRRLLADTDRTAVVKYTLRQKTRLGVLQVRGDTLVLQSILWADEIRHPEFPELDSSVKISKQEHDMAAELVDNFSGEFEPDDFVDDYQAELRNLINAKLDEGEAFSTPASDTQSESSGEVVDLMDALQKSVKKKSKSNASSSSKKQSTKKKSKAS